MALWDPENAWIEMRLRSTTDQVVHLEALDLEVRFAEGEDLHTEISSKFRVEQVAEELLASGFVVEGTWPDPDGDFLLTLARPV